MAEGGVVLRALNFEEQLSKFPVELVDSPCNEVHLIKLTDYFSKWQTNLSTCLELTAVEVQDIEFNWPRDAARQRIEMFRRWQKKKKSHATYRCVYIPSQYFIYSCA